MDPKPVPGRLGEGTHSGWDSSASQVDMHPHSFPLSHLEAISFRWVSHWARLVQIWVSAAFQTHLTYIEVAAEDVVAIMCSKALRLFCVPRRSLASHGTCVLWKIMLSSLAHTNTQITLFPGKLWTGVGAAFTFRGIRAQFQCNWTHTTPYR